MFVSFIFPCHNEELAIPITLPKAIQTGRDLLRAKSLKGFEIIAVDDGSTDLSLEKLKKYSGDIQIISLKARGGYGAGIKEAMRQAQGDWIAFCDLDGTCDPKELELLIDEAREKSRLAVWGNRLSAKSEMPFIRQLGNRLYQLAFLFLSFKWPPDVCSGFRLFKKSAFLPQIYDFPQDLSFSLALTAHCVRHKIPFSSIDISYKKRLGQSKLHLLKDGAVFLLNLIKFLFKKF